MNVVKEDESKSQKRLKIFYIAIVIICIIAIISAFVIQMMKNNEISNGGNTSTDLPQVTDDKISLFETYIKGDFKFFVDISLYSKIADNKFVIENLAGVFEDYPSSKIDEYIKSDKFKLSDCIVYYSSMKITVDLIKKFNDKIGYQYNSVTVKQKFNFFQKVFNWIYDKCIKFIFREKDELSSNKLQYMSKTLMQDLIDTRFNNRIFEIENSVFLDCEDKEIVKTMKNKFKLKKYNLFNMIFLVSLISVYVLTEALFKLPFWAYILFIFFSLTSIFLIFLLISYNIFELRYETKKIDYTKTKEDN